MPPNQLTDCTNILSLLDLALGGNTGGVRGGRTGLFASSLTCSPEVVLSLGLGGTGGCPGGDRSGTTGKFGSLADATMEPISLDGLGGMGGDVGSLPSLFFWGSVSTSSSIVSWATFGRCLRPGRVRNPEPWSGPFSSHFHLRGYVKYKN